MRFVALACLVLLAQPAEGKRFRMPKGTRQLVVVTSEGWTATAAKLQRYQRGGKGPWQPVGGPVDVVLGRAGLGWGYGLHPDETPLERSGPLKQEGDGRSPAGVFRLSEALGYAAQPPAGTRLAYRQSGPRLRCVDDRRSKVYNQIVEEPDSPPPWSSAETLKRDDPQYALLVVVDHNKKPVVPGQGSCIFLHVSGGAPTIGCTAMSLTDLEQLLAWLDPAAQPLLVQLPRPEYDRLSGPWKLP